MWIDYRLLISIAVIFAVWACVVVLSGVGWNPLQLNWNFANPGAFDDAFGPLGAGMASIAAVSAIATYRAQSIELERAKLREIDNDQAVAIVAFERTFFQLLDHHRQTVSSIDLDGAGPQRVGQDAFRSMVYYLRNRSAAGALAAWKETYSKYQNDLGHYFRFLYHMVRFLDRSNIADKYFYIQILRATLSESELILIGANCSFGEGREKFKQLIEKYSLLHNISDSAIAEFQFDSFLAAQAFARFDVAPSDSAEEL